MFFSKTKKRSRDLEEVIGTEWVTDHDIREVSLNRIPFFLVGVFLLLLVGIFGVRLHYLDIINGNLYRALAESNMTEKSEEEAPRGIISDRFGKVLAENAPTFKALLDVGKFNEDDRVQEVTFQAMQDVLGISPDMLSQLIDTQNNAQNPAPVLIADRLTSDEALALKGYDLPDIEVKQGFSRSYSDPLVFASVLGYVGFVGSGDIAANPMITYQDTVGKAGVELFYDKTLRGTSGIVVRSEDAHGQTLSVKETRTPAIGAPLRLTIDADFQKYFYHRMKSGLESLGKDIGVGIAVNPQNGEILALTQIPSYDGEVLSSQGHVSEKSAILTSPLSPLFDRAVGGLYSPGSTIKPLVGIAALADHVITPERQLFSPGYLDVPNPYDPSRPTRYLDWRYQGYVNMASAIAKSSDVYFYAVGGGAFDLKGLGIERLREWWQKFGLGNSTGIDLPGEKSGFLPSPDWKEKTTGHPWLLGDTYNVSIGQGDLLLTPIQILDYIAAIGADGTMYQPTLHLDASHPRTIVNFSNLASEIRVIQEGLKETVTTPLGTAYTLHDLPFTVAAKTGSAQVSNNTQENAFFVGYAPAKDPQIAILVLIEHSKEGSLNAVPIAKDVLNWYYENRLKK